MVILLITTKSKRTETSTKTSFHGMFVDFPNNDNAFLLGDTERNCLEMMRIEVCTWRCGCITAVPEGSFSGADKRLLSEHGKYKSFIYD